MKKNKLNEQINRIKSLFTEERLYGNLVEQKEELDNINKYGIIGTTDNIKLIKVTNSKFKIKPNGDKNLFKYKGDQVFPDTFIIPDVKSIFSSKIGLDLDKYKIKFTRERDSGRKDVLVFTITPKTEPETKPEEKVVSKTETKPEEKVVSKTETEPVSPTADTTKNIVGTPDPDLESSKKDPKTTTDDVTKKEPETEKGDITPKLQKYGAAQPGYNYIYDGKNKVIKQDKTGKILATYIRESYINKNSLFESVLTFEIKNSLLEGWKWVEKDKKFSQGLSDKFDKATGLSDEKKSEDKKEKIVPPTPTPTPKPDLGKNTIIDISWSSSDDHKLTTKNGYLVNIGNDSVDEVTNLVDGFVDSLDALLLVPTFSDINSILNALEKIKNIKVKKSDFTNLYGEDNYFIQSLKYSNKDENYLTEILNKAYKLDEDVSLKDDLNKLIKTYFSSQEYKSLIDKIKNILPSIKF